MAKKEATPRQKHVPIRTCVVCREARPKRELTRLVYKPEGFLQVDPSGKLPGRGAYLCDKPQCWHDASYSKAFEQALKTALREEDHALLEAYAAELNEVARTID
jgi:predicted RNA-binding protein YlxR (DUF448 family)